ncbi:MAG: flagellar biosynthetic protein FliO [Planctomycetes bacterium GWF2_41_51]|nr:MAG: flagellar biosynthetic protein FliO [Planctomycetes bacterium GWF2_41_51]
MKLHKICSGAIMLLCSNKLVWATVNAAEPNFSVGSGNNIAVSGLLYKMIFMVLMVIFLGVAIIFLSKKLLPKFNLPGKRIQIIEAVHLGPRKSLHLIKVGKKTLLIGSTNENISHLADLTNHIIDVNSPDSQISDN